jgi:hypothetical protein
MNSSNFDAVWRSISLGAMLALATGASASDGLPTARFPLGRADLVETRQHRALAPGVTLHVVQRGGGRRSSAWEVTAGVARTAQERARAVACLERIGVTPRLSRHVMPGAARTPYVDVTGGRYVDEAAARKAARRARGCTIAAQAVAASPHDPLGPWRLHIVEIQPGAFDGRLISTLSRKVASSHETVSMIAQRTRALVAINGGFFVTKPEDGVVGEPAGIAVIDGRIRSEPTANRAYLLLPGGDRPAARIVTEPGQALTIRWSDGLRTPLTGVDREPGVVRNCGTAGAAPIQDQTCHPADDLVAITPEAGFMPRAAGGTALVARDGRLVSGRPPQSGEILLAGVGTGASLLAARLRDAARAAVDLSHAALARDAARGGFAVNGGPLLIHDGKIVRNDDREGWRMAGVPLARANFVHDWTTLRNPRTAVGVGADQRIWLVVVEGREFAERRSRTSATSVGLGIDELRAVMAHLGARDALNLDGGGSSMLVIDGVAVTKPSDPGGERAIGDAIILTR